MVAVRRRASAPVRDPSLGLPGRSSGRHGHNDRVKIAGRMTTIHSPKGESPGVLVRPALPASAGSNCGYQSSEDGATILSTVQTVGHKNAASGNRL